MHAVIILTVVFLGLYLLYESGFIALQNKRAMLFAASINGSKAKFSSCTGKITRIVRFREQKEYIIRFEKTVEKGSVCLSLYDSEKNALIESGEEETYALSPFPENGISCAFLWKRLPAITKSISRDLRLTNLRKIRNETVFRFPYNTHRREGKAWSGSNRCKGRLPIWKRI